MSKLGVLMLGILVTAVPPAMGQDPPTTIPDVSFDGPTFIAVRVRDIDSAASWYQTVLGLQQVKRMEVEGGAYSIRLLSANGLTVELIAEQGLEPPTRRQLGLFKVGVFVTDIQGFHRRLHELGVEQDTQVFVDEALRVRSFVFRDLEGNRIQAFQRCGERCE